MQKQDRAAQKFTVMGKKSVCIDLGCGVSKQLGFVGLDRYPMPGVDVVTDLNQPLPLREDSVDLVYASHSLEHIDDLLAVMKEIYRICKHGAQVCIVAPYYQQSLNLGNPYHKQVFNEHSPRFWTNIPTTPIPAEEFVHPHASGWGLSDSDFSKPGIDFRCFKMEFFYFPEYRYLPPDEQRAARRKYWDVCDQIMFHLLVVKTPISETEVQQLTEQLEYYEPPFVMMRRLREQGEGQEKTIQELQQALAIQKEELEQAKTSLETVGARMVELEVIANGAREVLSGREAELEYSRAAVTTVQIQLAEQEAKAEALRQLLTARETELEQVRSSLKASQAELARQQATLLAVQQELQQVHTMRRAELGQVRASLAVAHQRLLRFEQSKNTVGAELTTWRRRRTTRWMARFRPGRDLRNDVDPAFQQLKDDSLLFTPTLRGFRLQASDDLRFVPFLVYPLTPRRPHLRGVLLAAILDFPVSQGSLGIEIVSPAHTIVTQSVVPVEEINAREPTQLQFAPIANADQGRFWLRVFVRDVPDPVRIFEWCKYSLGGLGRLHTRAFCGFLFA